MKRISKKPPTTPQTAEVVHLSHDGKGIARIQGKTTFIQGALPDEHVTFQYTRIKKDFDEGQLLEVIEPSMLRVEPKCPHYAVCGGCALQHMQEEAQIQYKQKHLLDLLTRYGHTSPQELLPPLTADTWHYRSKARLSVRYVERNGAALVGFRKRNNPRYIAEIMQCPVLHAKVDGDLIHFRQLIDAMEHKQCIAHIEVAAGDDEIGLILRNLEPLSDKDSRLIQAFAREYHYKIFLQPGGVDSVYCFYPPDSSEFLNYSLPDAQLTFAFHPTDFTQVNASLNQLMVTRAVALMNLQSTDTVLDLFCGLGNFSLPMANRCQHVFGIEGSKTMVERAYYNATLNHISNASFAVANLDDAHQVKKVLAHTSSHINKLLIDPPRAGALEVVKQIDALSPELIVYISCNPVTLARDTDILVNQHNYTLIKAGVMDMFPHTAHVESIALFHKR
jgi:23S rRNA (uracil1939-C5)-methyltransferase